MRLALVQSNPQLGAVEANLAAVQSAVEGAAFDVLVLPELFATGYFFHDQAQVRRLGEQVPGGPTTRFLIELAAAKESFVCGGLIEQEDNCLYNSAVLAGPEGFIGRYRKLHLFYEEKLWFTPGDGPLEVYDLGIARVGMMVCFDWRFPEVARILALKGAQVLLHPTNLVQPYCQDAMITRCLENGVFAVTANRIGSDTKPDGSSMTFTGCSQVVNTRGEVLLRATADEETVLTADVDPSEADDKLVTEHNHLLNDRRPKYYGLVAGKQL
ncbi:MAG: acyltransferase [Calditrichaeota bacterium]|nr:acyltransferase [Calditrichota bacterium]